MFNNLIESSSHVREYKRRGSFLLFTGATYVVLFVITGVVSIYAYDARLEDQTLEIVTLLPPQEIAPDREPAPAARPEHPRDTSRNEREVDVRSDPMLSVNHPEIEPKGVSTTPNKNPPVPDNRPWTAGDHDFITNPGSIGGPAGPAGGGRQVTQPATVVTLPDTPPPPDPPKPPRVVSKGVITSQATYLPKPLYSEIAKRLRIQGTVSVQVLVDEQGRVVSAKAVSGSPFLIPEAQKAAMQARFSPAMLGDQPVKVSGVITYNFVLSN
ncbi:MAG TPA: energy transducer TonB [Pyrinomonadaceae bacterium]|jgi:protein TonB